MNRKEKRVLVTGGAGFIGSAVITEMQKFGHDIFVIDDLSFGNKEFIDISDSHFFEIDIRDKTRLINSFRTISPHWIIHLAAIHFIPYCNQHPFEAADINIRGTMNVLEALRHSNSIEALFFASTAAVYPIFDDALDETHPVEPSDIYGLTKLTGEHLCHEFYLETSVPTIVCRFFNAFGPNETNPHLIPEIQDQVNSGLRTIKLGNLEPKRDFIHTADMANAVRLLMNGFHEGFDVFNLGRGIEYSVLEIVQAFERQLGQDVTIEADPNRVRKTDRLHLLADISKLMEFIDWEPRVGIDEGIRTLID